ncbi:FAD-dependent oxidoreductase [Sphingobium phenoxybenzoativorans]|uniref:FAD-dependent oxidoreductase n=1 Tax=Sphingobium phenoxybenzoativorans TaxID=1592790 RepID=UPI000872ACCD|nr:FAD-dependent oxidoreductase [Sphingobium phenoxybenzoativorans]
MARNAGKIVVVGGGPAGMMTGYLMARAGVETLVLEKHRDFLRDFRGDTVHPSTLELFRELGLVDGLLARPHDEVSTLTGRVAGKSIHIADFSRLPVQSKFIALMPQWDFLDFLADQARRLPGFSLRMEAEATGATFDPAGRVDGVTLADGAHIPARLVIAADGRRSVLRDAAALPREDLGAPMDVFWFRVPKQPGENRTTGVFEAGRIIALIDRGDYWQAAYVFAKGQADAVRSRGLAAFRDEIGQLAPELAPGIDALQDWDQVKLLTVSLDRLTRWHCPGLLAIGDAAHAMSPVGGVGINLAVQDAVAAANILAETLASGGDPDPLLAKVQQRRMFPTRVIQRIQKMAHDNIIGALLKPEARLERPPLALRMLDRYPALQAIPARVLGLGVRREHIRSPEAGLS